MLKWLMPFIMMFVSLMLVPSVASAGVLYTTEMQIHFNKGSPPGLLVVAVSSAADTADSVLGNDNESNYYALQPWEQQEPDSVGSVSCTDSSYSVPTKRTFLVNRLIYYEVGWQVS